MALNTGASVRSAWGKEATFAANNTQMNKAFGLQQKISGLSQSEGRKPLSQLGSHHIADFTVGAKTIGYNMEWILSNPDFLELLFDNKEGPTSNTVTYTMDNTGDSPTFSHYLRIGTGPSQVKRRFVGAILPSATIRYAVEGDVMCNASVQCGKELAAGTEPAAPSTVGDFPYRFESAEITLGGTRIANVQNAEFTIDPKHTLLREGGDHETVDAYKKLVEYTGKINATFINGTNLAYAKNRERENLALVITFSNNKTGPSEKTITFTFAGVELLDHTNPNIDPAELVFEDLSFQAETCTATYTRTS